MIDLSMHCGRALVALQAAGRIRVAFLPGMLLHEVGTTTSCRVTELCGLLGGVWRPDLTDAATVGCLLALLREARNDPSVRGPAWEERDPLGYRWPDHEYRWVLWTPYYAAPTEGEVLAAALIALAGVP